MSIPPDITSQLRAELDETRLRLAEAEETLAAIRNGEVDSLVVGGPAGDQVFTLKGAQEPYRLLIEQMSEGALTLSRDGVILYANQTFARLIQTPLERVIGAKLQAFVSAAEQPALAGLIEAAWSGSGSSRGEVTLRATASSSIPLQLGLCRLELGTETLVCVVAMDLTEARQKADELAELNAGLERRVSERTADLAASRLAALNMMEEACEANKAIKTANLALTQERHSLQTLDRMAVVVRDAHDAITVQDLDGRIIAWNPGAVRMYGWSESEALLLNVHDRIPHEQRDGALDKIAQLSRAEILEPYRTQRLTKDGRVKDVSIISTALLNDAGEMYAIATTERVIAGGAP